MFWLSILCSVLRRAPLGLYVLRKIRDPFNPLIFMGTLAYFISPHRLLTHPALALEFLPEEKYSTYLWVCIISMLGIYVGWWLGGKNRNTARIVERNLFDPPEYDISRWVIFGVVFALIAVPVHFTSLDFEADISGWYRDLQMLWVTSAVLLVQFYCASPSYSRGLVFFPMLLSFTPPIERFITYGQRGDTFRVAAIASLFYFAWNRRPSKLTFVIAVSVLFILLATLQLTRQMVKDGDAKNRVEAIFSVIPKFLSSTPEKASGADEYVFGSAGIDAVRTSQKFGYGTGITIGFVEHFVPRQILPHKDIGVFVTPGFDADAIRAITGVVVPPGSAPGGFSHAFFELGWGCPLIWIILAYFYRLLWDRVRLTPDFLYQGLLVGYTMAMLYAMTQDLVTGEVNIIYTFVPLYFVYKLSRVKREDTGNLPILTTTDTVTVSA